MISCVHISHRIKMLINSSVNNKYSSDSYCRAGRDVLMLK